MDTGKFTCNVCSGKIRVDFEMCGDTIECPHCSNMIMVPLTGISAGMTVAIYTLKRRLGMGAMGEVWLALEPASGRRVALKILSPTLTRDSIFIKRFEREVSMAAEMSHPNIITAFDAGVDRGIYFLAINYVEGEDIETILRQDGKFSENEALAIALLMAEALHYAFDKHDIIHRDIKPSNIMIDRNGTPFLMDLGVSRRIGKGAAALTTAGQFVGTPHYMSPEQARADNLIGPASDIYSLGCSLYHMLTGSVPFKADSNVEILSKHINEKARPIRSLNPDVSPECEALIEKMMSKDCRTRPSSWSEVIAEITFIIERNESLNQGDENRDPHRLAPGGADGLPATEDDEGMPGENLLYSVAGVLFGLLFLILIWIVLNL